ncbi:hypothetical protein D3C83_51510 [compost metagenome]
MRGNGEGNDTPRTSLNTSRTRSSMMRVISSCPRNEVSISIWVNSGWRSARRSSSRKHFTIW